MIFNQFEFLFLYLPLVLLGTYVICPASARSWFLIIASFLFYGISGALHGVVLAAAILWTYFVTLSPSVAGSKWRLAVAISFPLAALVYFKYLGFLIHGVFNVGHIAGDDTFSLFDNIVLPAGISFFTFHLMAYSIDRYRGTIAKAPSFTTFTLFISFFPHLVAGPILRLPQVWKALEEIPIFRPTRRTFAHAIACICWGLSYKVLLADTLANYIEPYVGHPGGVTFVSGTYVIFAYSFQIYFDFYGYSLMAIGLAALFGLDFPANFVRPYESLNPRDFWRRWHVTLSFWIRDYLYFPLGGNRAYVRNIAIVFLACGLWHGAGWNFVVWGAYHAALIIGYHGIAPLWNRMPRFSQVGLTFVLVSLGWILFLFDLPKTAIFIRAMIDSAGGTIALPSIDQWSVLLGVALICFSVQAEKWIVRAAEGDRKPIVASLAYAVLFAVAVVFLDRSRTFIYFQF